MTVRVTTLKGAEAGRYYTEHLPSYYLDGDEPPGRWWGQGADRLGLHGVVEPDAFLAVMAGCDPATGRDLGRRFGEGSVRGLRRHLLCSQIGVGPVRARQSRDAP